MGKVIKGNFGGEQENLSENSPDDNAANKPAEVVEISPGVRKDEQSDVADSGGGKESQNKRDLIKNGIASIAKEFPVPEIGRLNKMVEALAYMSSLGEIELSAIRAGDAYKTNATVFEIYLEKRKDKLYKTLNDSSVVDWLENPNYYLALIDVLQKTQG